MGKLRNALPAQFYNLHAFSHAPVAVASDTATATVDAIVDGLVNAQNCVDE